MSDIIINGGKKVNGTINIEGSKNSVLPILVSCLITNSISTITNCPKLSDVDATLDILKKLGCKITTNGNTVTVDSRSAKDYKISNYDSCQMRASIIFLGALLSRFKRADMYTPGGCNLGKRPIDLHISSLKELGASIDIDNNNLIAEIKGDIRASTIRLKISSVGATENIVIASCISKNTTILHNAAKEPEICDLVHFLNSCGANIQGVGTETITIKGVGSLKDSTYRIMPDRIVTISYMSICAVCGGELCLTNTNYKDIKKMLPYFLESGCNLDIKNGNIKIKSDGLLKNLGDIVTAPYPAFPTDAQPIFVAMATRAEGISTFVETMFENRYVYTKEIAKLGARIDVDKNVAKVYGRSEFICDKVVKATDLRGGMALIILACCINGTTVIGDTHHIYRGYSNIIQNLQNIGINIKESIDEGEQSKR